MDASRWTYNLTVEILKGGAPAAWKTVAARVMAEVERKPPRVGACSLPGQADLCPGCLQGNEQPQKGQQKPG